MILFFDTETTGLPKNWKAPVTDLDNWPRLVQLAYLVYDFDGNLIHSCNEIIKPNGFTIPMEASKVHGITTNTANQRGSQIEEVFELFSIHLKRAKVIVAHNMAYDEKIIGSELIRLGLESTLDSKEKICTMESTVDLCKIDGPYGYKWPKLEELHRFLFNHDFEGAHDALADIQATARCFWELKKIGVIHLFKKYMAPNAKSLMEKLKKTALLNENKKFDVPFLIIDKEGEELWTIHNTKLDLKHWLTFEYHKISEVMNSRIPGNENLWNNIFYNVSFWKDTSVNPLFNKEELWIEKWNNWEIKNFGELYFRDDFILDIPKLYTIGLIGLNQKMNKVRRFKFYYSENNISKVVAHYRYSHFSGIFGDGEETVYDEYYFTLFYIDQNGSVFLENNQLEFDPESCVPFLKIDAEGKSSWQFYNYEKDLFFGRIFEDHNEVEKEITLYGKSKNFWWTTFSPNYTGHLIELGEWKGWSTNDEGDLFFNEEFKLNLFDLKLDFSYVDGGPILRFLDSENHISKLIAYCQDGDQDGVYDWYETQFYVNDSGRIYLENNYTPPKEFDIFDAWEAIAEYEAEKNFHDDDFGMIP
jgi:DNA polymerase III epsilon subunit-like protein